MGAHGGFAVKERRVCVGVRRGEGKTKGSLLPLTLMISRIFATVESKDNSCEYGETEERSRERPTGTKIDLATAVVEEGGWWCGGVQLKTGKARPG